MQIGARQGSKHSTLHPLRTHGSLLSVDCAMRQLNQGLQMSQQTIGQTFDGQVSLNPSITVPACDRNWHAVYTVPQHEKSALKHLDLREIESFLPVYETVRVWNKRQRMKHSLPLFPNYQFVHINFR